MGIFGWDLPPGAANDPLAPYNQDDVCPESEEVWGILEEAGVDETVIEKVVEIVEKLAADAAAECQVCLAQQAREADLSP